MIKIFMGGRGDDTFKNPPPPKNNFCLYPPLRTFRKDSLMTSHHSRQGSYGILNTFFEDFSRTIPGHFLSFPCFTIAKNEMGLKTPSNTAGALEAL